MMRRLQNILLLAEIFCIVLFPIVTWAMSMMGSDVVNLFSEDSLRWLFLHFGEMLVPGHFAAIVFMLLAVGIWQEPGIRDINIRSGKSYIYYVLFLFLLSVLLRWPVMLGYTPLLGIDGSEIPSPWFSFSPYVLCITVIFFALIYAYKTGVATTLTSLIELIKSGSRRHAPWLLVVMLGNLLFSIVVYALSL